MKKLNFKFAISATIAVIALFTSCESEQQLTPPAPPNVHVESESATTKLNPSTVELNETDAITVADIYSKKIALSRSDDDKTVKDIVTINDSNGKPAIYAVNFEDGYIFVSATKKYFPILAEVEHGTFTIDKLSDTGLGIIVSDMLANIEIARQDEYDFKPQVYWRDYVDNKATHLTRMKSRANDDYWAEYERWWFSDKVYGYNVYYLHDCLEKEILSEEVYNRYVRAVQDEDAWEGTDYSWYWTAYVVEEVVDSYSTHGPLLTTKWGQGYPYNTTDYSALGCVTIATAQLMKYYKHPSIFEWDKMPDVLTKSSDSPELTSFLANLRSELNVDEAGGATILDAKRVLQNYGYNVSHINHDDSKIVKSLERDYPVYTRGAPSSSSGGHAWVVDGVKHRLSMTRYVLYRLADYHYPKFQYDEAQCYDMYYTQFNTTSYHMNWGWDGKDNGWFLDNQKLDVSGGNYSHGRQEIIINSFK